MTTTPTPTDTSATAAPRTGPRNQLGQPATRTPEETIARLQEKVSDNHGGANRDRIRARIREESRASGSLHRLDR